MWFTLVFDIRSNEMKCLSIEHISHIVKRTKAFSIDCFYRLFLLCFCGFFSPFETGFYLIDHSHFYRDLFDLRRDFAVCNWPQISLNISRKHTIAWILYHRKESMGILLFFFRAIFSLFAQICPLIRHCFKECYS